MDTNDYRYVWKWRKWPATEWRDGGPWEDLRRGQRCRMLVRGGAMNSCLLEFEDGFRMVASRNGLIRFRKVE